MEPLMLQADDPYLVRGSRPQAEATFNRRGLALWLKPNGTVELLYREGGAMRSRLFPTVRIEKGGTDGSMG